MKKTDKTRFLRLVSAQRDMTYALDAYDRFKHATSERERYNFVLAMVVSYGRPFTENKGLGNLEVDNREFPDYDDEKMNLRHQRLIAIRHNFLAHSAIDGLRVHVIPPHVANPNTGEIVDRWSYNVGRLEFLKEEYVDWLQVIIADLNNRLRADIARLLPIYGPSFCPQGLVVEVGGPTDFSWDDSKSEKT